MQLQMDLRLADGYKSPSQRARRITEGWCENNMYCPACLSRVLRRTRDNTRVVDFVCPSCQSEYQLKAKGGLFGRKLRDAAYAPMMERALNSRSPHFLFLGYEKRRLTVLTLLLVPGHFIVPSVIEKCKPLSDSARRAGWTGCNILVDRIPDDGRLMAVCKGIPVAPDEVRERWQRFEWAKGLPAERTGWLFDVLRCVRSLGEREFKLEEMYAFKDELAALHPSNRHVTDKIRQQLQFLRDRDIIRFVSRGRYVAI